MEPLVSVLIPAYNAELYLGDCLESALVQTYPRIEVIVVDDGSTDGTYEITKKFQRGNCRVARQSNQGQASALNHAMSLASGDYFQFLDADDILDPRKIEHQIARLRLADPFATATGAWTRFSRSPAGATFKPESVWQDLSPIDWLICSWRGGGMMHVAAWLIPTAVVHHAGAWSERLTLAANLDGHFFTRVVLASSVCLFCPDARSFYRSGHASMSGWQSRQSAGATLQVIVEMGDALLQAANTSDARRAFAANLQRFVYGMYPQNPDLVKAAESRIALLGGSDLDPGGSILYKRFTKLLGWKASKRVQRVIRRIRYGIE